MSDEQLYNALIPEIAGTVALYMFGEFRICSSMSSVEQKAAVAVCDSLRDSFFEQGSTMSCLEEYAHRLLDRR